MPDPGNRWRFAIVAAAALLLPALSLSSPGAGAKGASLAPAAGRQAVARTKALGDGVVLSGGFTYEIRDGRAFVTIGEIRNGSSVRVTGELRLALWATYPWWYREGESGFSGFRLALFDELPSLAPGGSHRQVSQQAAVVPPLPPGAEMTVVLVLLEYKPSLCGGSVEPGWCHVAETASTVPLSIPPRADSLTLLCSSFCIENMTAELAAAVRAANPGFTWITAPDSVRCADVDVPVFAGYLRSSATYVPYEPGSPGLARVYAPAYLNARYLCQSSLVVDCVMGAPAGGAFTDLWWNANEPGWGVSVTHHASGTAFVVWYLYDAAGRATWYVAPDCRIFAFGCESALYETTGPPLGPAFDASRVALRPVGSLRLQFLGDEITMRYEVDGQSGTRSITRQPF